MEKIVLIFLALIIYGFSFGQTINDLRPTVTMKEYVDMQAMYLEKINTINTNNINDNVTKANASMEKRLDAINEFRGQLKDQAGTFITRSELFAWIVAVFGGVIAIINIQRKKVLDK